MRLAFARENRALYVFIRHYRRTVASYGIKSWCCLGVLEGNRNLLLDAKVINSFFVLAAYAFYLFQHKSMRISGNRLAVWNLAAF